ncbi:MAG TPA: nitrophenyl compound nitroreductase subunit ArsF family protein, partial [Phycisphaerae bacterium]|nr:nitrophenyl compound nitroreductase subunit ArsF family protein [Phycisphaerae bacterium]
DKLKKAVTGVLLCFVLISIGYAIGKEVTLHRLAGWGGRSLPPPATVPASGNKVMVYYMHPTIRCVTCNAIEKAAREAVQQDFAVQLETGGVQWKVVNFSEDEALAKRYNVASSTVVVVHLRGGKEVRHEKLDKVWELAEKPAELRAYVAGKIQACFRQKSGEL